MRLLRNSAVILRQPRAKGWHAVIPATEVVQRYFRLGRDAASVRSITARESGAAYLGAMAPDRAAAVGRVADRLRQVAQTQPAWLLLLPLALPVMIVTGLAYVAGRLSARRMAAAQ